MKHSPRPFLQRGEDIIFYSGPSMNPLLRENDLLEVLACDSTGARPGDVIAFMRQDDLVVVHRVVGIRSEGLITRGDNNRCFDDFPVREGQVIGRVTVAYRGKRKIDVFGGGRGFLLAQFCYLKLGCRNLAASFLRTPYHLCRSWVSRLPVPARAKEWPVTFSSAGVSITRLIRR